MISMKIVGGTISKIEFINAKGLRFIIGASSDDLLRYPYSSQDRTGAPTLMFIEEDDQLLLRLHVKYANRAIAGYSGRNRNTFILNDRLVVKLPRNADGCMDNEWEGCISNSTESIGDPLFVQYPRTRLAYVEGIPVVFMERISHMRTADIVRHFGAEPDWVNSVDGGQVGVNRFGRLVAYDYGVR